MSRLKTNKRKKEKKIRKHKQWLMALLLILFSITIIKVSPNINKRFLTHNNDSPVLQTFNKDEDITTSLSISAVGDIMVHEPQLKAQYDSKTNTYSFDNNFIHLKKYIEKSDLSIGNLETTLAGNSTPYTSYPTFNSPDSLATALKNSGFDLLSTINNHSLDKGESGVLRTLQVLKEIKVSSVGTRTNEKDSNYIIEEINNIKLGITSFSYGSIDNSTKYLNGIPASSSIKNNLNVIDMKNVDNAFQTIEKTLLSMPETDFQIVILHWGNEYQRNPSEFQINLARKLSDAGVDIIIGSHPHVVQPVEMITSSNGQNQTLVVYSLGNLISNQRREYMNTNYTEDGLLVEIEISKKQSENKAIVSNVTCIPIWVNMYKDSSKLNYEVIPIVDKDYLSALKNIDINKLKQSYINTSSQINTSDIINCSLNPFE